MKCLTPINFAFLSLYFLGNMEQCFSCPPKKMGQAVLEISLEYIQHASWCCSHNHWFSCITFEAR